MGTKVATARTIVCLLMRCFGCYGRSRHGAISIRHLDTGTVCSNAFIGCLAGVWNRVFKAWAAEPNFALIMLDATIVRRITGAFKFGARGDSESGDRSARASACVPRCHIAVEALGSADADHPRRMTKYARPLWASIII